MLLYMYITLLYCSVPAWAEFLFTLENTNIKSWLSAGQTLNHNNWYPYAILLIIWNSITKTRFFFFFPVLPRDTGSPFWRSQSLEAMLHSRSGAQSGIKARYRSSYHKTNIACFELVSQLCCPRAASTIFPKNLSKTERFPHYNCLFCFFQLNSCANSWGIIPGLELMRYIIIVALQPRQLETLYLSFQKQTVKAQNSTETNLSCFLMGYINPYKPPCFQHFTGFQYPNELISSCSDSTTAATAMQQLVDVNKYSNQGWY